MQDFKEYTIWNAVTPVAVTSSTDATPIVVTATSHGFSTGDLVMISGHTTNIAANGIFKITKLTANTFSLQNYNTGADVAGSGSGSGSSGVVVAAPKIVFAQDYDSAILEIATSGTATMTVKVLGAQGKVDSYRTQHGDTPNFGATLSPSNNYSYVQSILLADNSAVDGATGIVVAGTDVANSYEININHMKYLTLNITSWSAGAITAKLTVYKED